MFGGPAMTAASAAGLSRRCWTWSNMVGSAVGEWVTNNGRGLYVGWIYHDIPMVGGSMNMWGRYTMTNNHLRSVTQWVDPWQCLTKQLKPPGLKSSTLQPPGWIIWAPAGWPWKVQPATWLNRYGWVTQVPPWRQERLLSEAFHDMYSALVQPSRSQGKELELVAGSCGDQQWLDVNQQSWRDNWDNV